MQHTVVGMFSSSDDANRAAERLRSSGFSDHEVDISSVKRDSYTSQGGTFEGTRGDSPYNVSDESTYDTTTSTSSSSYSDNLNEERIRNREARKDDDDSFGESIGRFFRNLFDNKEEAEKYATVGSRNCIVSVFAETREQAEKAAEILDESGAIDVDESVRQYGSYSDTDSNSFTGHRDTVTSQSEGTYTDTTLDQRTDSDELKSSDNEFRTSDSDFRQREKDEYRTSPELTRNDLDSDDVRDRSIPVIEENINIGKREVESGGVRIRSRIVERPVEENLRLREERVFVERNPVNRPATERDFDTFREGEVELTETSEVPIVNKEARVVEEVRLNKEVNEREETVRDTVRKTDVDVENLSEDQLRSRKGKKR